MAYDDPIPYDDPLALYDVGGSSVFIFNPPCDDIVPPVYVTDDPYYPSTMNPLMRHFRNQTRGRNIFLMSDGTFIDSQLQYTPPNMIQPPEAPYARAIYEQGGAIFEEDFFQVPYVVRTYYGGANNYVTPAEAAALTAAGYTVG